MMSKPGTCSRKQTAKVSEMRQQQRADTSSALAGFPTHLRIALRNPVHILESSEEVEDVRVILRLVRHGEIADEDVDACGIVERRIRLSDTQRERERERRERERHTNESQCKFSDAPNAMAHIACCICN